MHEHDNRQNETDETVSEDIARNRQIGRREFILAGGTTGTILLSGCSGNEPTDGEPPNPVSLSGGKTCDVCGMVISEHPGPNGQIFYRENGPETHDNPARFDSMKACLFPYSFEHERLDWTAEAVYVTDYSRIDYEVSVVENRKYIQTATGAETFSNADDVVFVVESEVHGAMGPDFIPFSDEEDGESFADEFGGRIIAMDAITPEMLGR